MSQPMPPRKHRQQLEDKRKQRAAQKGRKPAIGRRWVSKNGPDDLNVKNVQAPIAPDEVSFVGSAKELAQARLMKGELENEEKDGASFLIYHLVRMKQPFILWKDATAPTKELSFGHFIGFDLFRVPKKMAGDDAAIAEAIETILKDFGQTGNATGVPPR